MEGQRKFMGTLWNTYAFYVLYAEIDQFDPTKYELDYDSLTVMDRWILSRTSTMVKTVDEDLGSYRIPEAARALDGFVDELSNWYVRRCRERFWAHGMEQDKINAYMTLYTALITVAKAAAPMIPFMAEEIYQNLVCGIDKSAPESIHLCDFPEVHEEWIDEKLEEEMRRLLKIVVFGRASRNASGIKNRQPIGNMYIRSDEKLSDSYVAIIEDELNVKHAEFCDDVSAYTTYTFKPQLKTVGPKYGKFLKGIQTALAELDGNAAYQTLQKDGKLTLPEVDASIELTEDDLLITQTSQEGFVSDGDNEVTVVLDTNLTPELIHEGFVREIISKLQTMRKEADFDVTDEITVFYEGSENIERIFEESKDSIAHDVLAKEIRKGTGAGYDKAWNINGEDVRLCVTKD